MAELDNVKVGDTLLVYGNFYATRLSKVEKVTKTQIIVGGNRYNKRTGRLVGSDSWHALYIKIPTDAEREEIERIELIGDLKFRIRTLNAEVDNFDKEKAKKAIKYISELINS